MRFYTKRYGSENKYRGLMSRATGSLEDGPYDAIHVGAAAPTMPAALVEQLARPGRMFIPVGDAAQQIIQVDKDVNGVVTETPLLEVMVSCGLLTIP